MKKNKINILLADDDTNLSTIIVEHLSNIGYKIDWVQDGQAALQKFYSEHYDLCLLDVSMPQKTGFEVLEEIRTVNTMPVIFVTAHTAKEDIIKAYQLGCDDYITKPFSLDILVCKIEAMIRRIQQNDSQLAVKFNLAGMHFDSVGQTLDGQHLSARESDLLLMLCQNKNQMVERSKILKTLWQTDDYFAARSLSVYINHLRNLLRPVANQVQLLAVHGRGYKMIVN
ncbi:MAG: response regulator transcription factor [Bacteroidales bacterium]|nr:response regulator transcription factor [Candidatus Colicola coprequi]